MTRSSSLDMSSNLHSYSTQVCNQDTSDLPNHLGSSEANFSSPGTHEIKSSFASLVKWQDLQRVGSEIDRWAFVADYDALPEIVWEMWNNSRSGTSHHGFTGWLNKEIARGEKYIASLIDLMPGGVEEGEGDLRDWALELGELLSKVHRAISALEIRREQVDTGLVRKYPKILCPPHLDC
jgi:hypothetical protein